LADDQNQKRVKLKTSCHNGNLYTKDVPVHAIIAYRAKVQLHSFSTSATDRGKANFTTGHYSPRERAEKVG